MSVDLSEDEGDMMGAPDAPATKPVGAMGELAQRQKRVGENPAQQ